MDPSIHLGLEILTLVLLGSGFTLAFYYLMKSAYQFLRGLF